MFSFLKNHPFEVEAFFESSLVLTFAVPKQELQKLIPECLELDVFNDKFAFIAVAIVQTTGLRPKGFLKFLGGNFILIGYRVFVRYVNITGKKLRGLYILKSQTNKKKMEIFGNIFTHYNYTTTDIQLIQNNNTSEIRSVQSGFRIETENKNENVPLPQNSPFADWNEARKFAGPMPFTFTYNATEKSVLIIEGIRQNWMPNPIKVIEYNIPFLDNLKLKEVELANAFIVNRIPYQWKKGKIEKW